MTRRTRTEVDAQHQTERVARRSDSKTVSTGTELSALHRLAGAEEPLPAATVAAAVDTVRRFAHPTHADELLAILGLADDDAPAAVPTKHCPGCEQVKPRTEFSRAVARPSGRATYCKACASDRERAARGTGR